MMRYLVIRVIVLTLLLTATGCGPSSARLEPVPRPSLEALGEAARSQIETKRRALDALLQADQAPAEELATAFGELGRSYLDSELHETASTCLVNAVRLRPREFRWQYYLGYVLWRRGKLAEANRHFAQALAQRPNHLPARLHLARVALDQGDLKRARRLYQGVLEDNPDLAAALYALGLIALEEGKPAEAIEPLSRAVELAPEASAVHHSLGIAYRRTGDLERARQHLELAGTQRPHFDDPLLDSPFERG